MNDSVNNNLKLTDYILCYILIAISGVNFFLGNTILAIVFGFTLLIFYKKIKFSNFIIYYLVTVLIILLGSAIMYSSFNLNNYLSLLFRIGTAYIIIFILGEKFIYAYIKILYYLSLISLFFWTTFVLFPGFERFVLFKITPFFDHYLFKISESDNLPAPHFIIYTMNHIGMNLDRVGLSDALSNLEGINRINMRNSVCFTEPSTAMLFIIPALSFSLILFKRITCKEVIVFILVILTSWSTGGYAILFFILMGWYFTQKGGKNKLIMFPISILVAYFAFFNVESFGLEIMEKANEASSANLQYAKRTRLVNAVLDIEESFNHPIFGKGFYVEDRSIKSYFDWRTNGTTYLLNRYGYIAFFLYFFLIYKFFKLLCISYNINKQFALVMIISLIFIGFGNKNFEKPLFISLTMIYSILSHQYYKYNN